jgi:hypothetical protein
MICPCCFIPLHIMFTLSPNPSPRMGEGIPKAMKDFMIVISVSYETS